MTTDEAERIQRRVRDMAEIGHSGLIELGEDETFITLNHTEARALAVRLMNLTATRDEPTPPAPDEEEADQATAVFAMRDLIRILPADSEGGEV